MSPRKTNVGRARESETFDETFMRVAECTPGVLVVYDPERRIRFINARGVTLSGYSRTEIIGRRDEELFPDAVTRTYLPTLLKAVKSRRLQKTETDITLPIGARHVVEVTYLPLLNSQGRIRQILGITHDITDRRNLECELHRRNHQLAQLATEMTLIEQRERRRLADVVHDHLQQLLVGARMQAFALSSGGGNVAVADLEALQGTIHEALLTARQITMDLAPPVAICQDLPTAFQWLVREFQRRHDLQVKCRLGRLPSAFPQSVCVLLYTAARELLLNVVKHAGVSRAILHLSRLRGDLVLEVSDLGCGLSFGKERDPSGKGFGLFSIRERAELLGGSFTLTAGARGGARARLVLPASVVELTGKPEAAV